MKAYASDAWKIRPTRGDLSHRHGGPHQLDKTLESIHLGMLRHSRFADLRGQWIAIRCSVIVEKLGNTDWIRR
jgi:hypothetical protein